MISADLLPPSLRDDFPLLFRSGQEGKPCVYLDSAASSLKPVRVIRAVAEVLEAHPGNVHRSVHHLGDAATERFEYARGRVAQLIGAEAHELVFVRNTTEALNLVARCWPRRGIVLVSLGEHHSNLLPWGPEAVHIPPLPDGNLNENAFVQELSNGGVALVALSHVSNVTGGQAEVRRLADAAHAAGAILVLDGAQSVPHQPIDVRELDCDFLAFSSHKMCGPSGVGALYGKAERLAELRWYLHGGGTVEGVDNGRARARQNPWRFEAGTPAIEAAVGFGTAADYLLDLGLERIERHGSALRSYARRRLLDVRGVRIVEVSGQLDPCGPLSFVVAGVPSHTIARSLSDSHGICIRSGFHCAEPLHEALHLPATVRLSFYLYNQPWEIDRTMEALDQLLVLSRKLA